MNLPTPSQRFNENESGLDTAVETVATVSMQIAAKEAADVSGHSDIPAAIDDAEIDKLQRYYGLVIRNNTDSINSMKRAIWATYFHKASTNAYPQHGLCPTNEDTWCEYNRAITTGELYKHKITLPSEVFDCIKDVYRELSTPIYILLAKCLHKSINGTEYSLFQESARAASLSKSEDARSNWTMQFLADKYTTGLERPPYSQDFTPFDFHLFLKVKNALIGTHFQSVEVKTKMTDLLKIGTPNEPQHWEIGSRVGRNQITVKRICDLWMQEDTTDQRDRSHPPQCTTSREDRQIVHVTLMDHSVTSRIVTQHIESVTHHSVSARTIRRRLQQSGLSARRPLLSLP
ncbi:transposable element Tcb1 transposase [Trichonephila clavipes]|uniref:Transposable element Tcb1 transposase n=1 Tax=Trichonephila clavipes TaxID=2585209 RepID=A0A8X6WLB1_TRICX|nr:transposable element Tcb1 transposase [Trichonephila clavipes]